MTDAGTAATLRLADFEPDLGRAFPIARGDAPVLSLAEVRASPYGTRDGGGFALVFTIESGPALAQGTYPVRHPRLGPLDLFLVPLGPRDGVARYQAVFT